MTKKWFRVEMRGYGDVIANCAEVNRPGLDGSRTVFYWHAESEDAAKRLSRNERNRQTLNARRAGVSKAAAGAVAVTAVKVERVELGEAETLKRVQDKFLGLTMRQFGEWLRGEIAKSTRQPPNLRVVGSK